MIKTIDGKGIERTMTLTVWNLLPINPNGSRGQNELVPVVDEMAVSEVENDIFKFIESKKKIAEAVVTAQEAIEIKERKPRGANKPK